MNINTQDARRDQYMLTGSFARRGYDWWWHSFTAVRNSDGAEVPFFIEFFLCNPALGGAEPVLGQLPENQRTHRRPSYLMVKAGCWGAGKCQLHRFFGWDAVTVGRGAPYSVEAGDCFASETQLRGSVRVTPAERDAHPEWMCDSGEMRWSLTLDKRVAFNVGYGASRVARDLKAFQMYWHAQGMKTLCSGTITLNGEDYTVRPETSYGYADKNWGRGFTSPWVWLSSWDLTSRLTGRRLENTVFDLGGGRPKVYMVPLDRKLLGALWYEGRAFEYNFSKPWNHRGTVFSSEETDTEVLWHIRQENRDSVMETEIRCPKADMLLVNYEDPDGRRQHRRLWNGGTGTGVIRLYEKTPDGPRLLDEMDAAHVGCEYGEFGAGEDGR